MKKMKKDFLTLRDLTPQETWRLIDRALAFKKTGRSSAKLKNRVLGLIFEKESTRTRISFEVAMVRLGGTSLYMGQKTLQLSRGETYADTARVLSRYLDGVVLRTFAHKNVAELARHASIPVINGLTDLYHPCQLLADLMTIKEKKGDPRKKNIVYVGDGNNMAHSWLEAALHLDLKVNIACPRGYEVGRQLMEGREKKNILMTNDPLSAVQGGDVINTDTWFSMGQEVTEAKREAFRAFQVNRQMLESAAKGAIILHCLPAHRGEEITDEVIEGPQSVVFDQAENRLYVQMALLESLLGGEKKPAAKRR